MCNVSVSAARDDSPAAEVSAEKCVSYKVMKTWKESGEGAMAMQRFLWAPPCFVVLQQRLFEEDTSASSCVCLELTQQGF